MNSRPVPPYLHFEIDGKREEFTHFYGDEDWPNCGAVYGWEEGTKASDEMRGYSPTKCVWPLAVWRKNNDGSITGMKALFAGGIWATTEDDEILLRVWDRII